MSDTETSLPAQQLNHTPDLSVLDEQIHIGPSPIGRGFRLVSSQIVPLPREVVFEFFADAFQLESITPPWLRFSVQTSAPIQIGQGTTIDYQLRLHGIPLRWQSRISIWEPPHRFVDEQMRGPYRRWHHEHVFEPISEGTLCRDIVDYEVFGGRLIDALLVRPDLRKIFQYRRQQLARLLPNSGRGAERSITSVSHPSQPDA